MCDYILKTEFKQKCFKQSQPIIKNLVCRRFNMSAKEIFKLDFCELFLNHCFLNLLQYKALKWQHLWTI